MTPPFDGRCCPPTQKIGVWLLGYLRCRCRRPPHSLLLSTTTTWSNRLNSCKHSTPPASSKVWSTVKIRGTRVPQKAIVSVCRPRPYSIIIINMRFIPKASLRASSQITASSYILERHLWVNNSKHFALAPTWSLACKQTDCITAGIWKLLDPKSLYWNSVNTKHLYDFMQCWTNDENVGPTLYKCYTNVL